MWPNMYEGVNTFVPLGPNRRMYNPASMFTATRVPGNTGILRQTFSTAGNAYHSSYLRGIHRGGMSFATDLFGMTRKQPLGKSVGMTKYVRQHGLMRFLGPMAAMRAAYEGYQQGGIAGAVGGVAKEAAAWYMTGAAVTALKPFAIGAAGLAGFGALFGASIGIGPRQLARPYVSEYLKKRGRMEMGEPVDDPYGQVATMRQRSIAAIQNSRINGRSAIGNEAMLYPSGGY